MIAPRILQANATTLPKMDFYFWVNKLANKSCLAAIV